MTELEWFGWAVVFATGLCAAVWLTLAGCILLAVYEWARSKHETK